MSPTEAQSLILKLGIFEVSATGVVAISAVLVLALLYVVMARLRG
jgi:hypothetical protein